VPNWLDLETLAHRIYSELEPGAQVTHDDHLRGRLSGELRQIDVSIRSQVAGHEILTIIDTKDYGHPAGIGEVDEFAGKVDDVGAHKGVLICRSGFTGPALLSARSRGIDLCQVHDASTRRWSLDVRLPFLWVDLTPRATFKVGATLLGGDSFPKDPFEWAIVVDGGTRRLLLRETFESAWNRGDLPRDLGRVHNVVDRDRAGGRQFAVIDSDGKVALRPVDEVLISYEVERKAYLGYLTPAQCRGIQHPDGRFVASYVALADLPLARDPGWPEVDPENLPIALGTTVITSETFEIDLGSGTVHEVFMNFGGAA